jgi:hypothetical protein
LNFCLEPECSSPYNKFLLLHFLLLFRSSGELFNQKICGFSTFQVLAGGKTALALSSPGGTKASRSKTARGCVLTAAAVPGGRKNEQIYSIERAKKMSSGCWLSEDVVPGKKHIAYEYNQKFKNFV